jgi:hypothetical protein
MKRYGFNLKYQEFLEGIEDNERFEDNLYLNKVLLSGDPSVVERYYKEEITKFAAKYEQSSKKATFWHNVGPKNARVFFGLTKMINDAIVRMVTSGGMAAKVFQVSEKGEETDDLENTERLDNILEENDFYDKKWGLLESLQGGYGFGSFKISIDDDIIDVPIIETIQPEKLEVETERGFITAYRYKTRQTVSETEYEVHEIYTKRDKKPIIIYEIFRMDAGEGTLVKAASLDDVTFNALGLDFMKEGDTITEENHTFSKLSRIPVLLKNNTPYNSWFPSSPFGEADTQGIELIEDALSELISALVEEVRKGRIKVLISEQLVPKGLNGLSKGFDDFKIDYEIIKEDEKDGKNLIQVVQGDINTEKYIAGVASLIMYGCNKANIHPITVGITGVESIAASQDSQVEREKVSMRTREMKLKSWRKELMKFLPSVLQADDVLNDIDPKEYIVKIDFGQFSNPTRESVIGLLNEAVTSGVLSIWAAQEEYFGENATDEEKEEAYLRTLVEKGIPLNENQLAKYNEYLKEKEALVE